MRTDPRKACANERQLWWWAAVHDAICHPLMVFSFYSKWSMLFHDWTSFKAWPRVEPVKAVTIEDRQWGPLLVREVSRGCFEIQHPNVGHKLVTSADDAVEACELASHWFTALAAEFGGPFALPIDRDDYHEPTFEHLNG